MKRSKLKIKPKFSKSSDWEIVEDIPMAQDGGYQWSTQKQEPVKLAIPKDVNVSKTESNRKLTPKELEELRKYTEEQNQLRKEEEYNKRLQAIQQANQAKNQPLTIDNLRTQTQATGDKMSFAMNTRFGNPKEYPTLSGYMDALDFINPGKFIGDMATGLGALPYNVREGNYGQAALAIGTPLTTGALAGIGVNSTKQFVNNLANPVAGIDFKQLKHLNVYKHLPEDATATTLGFGNKNPYLHNKKQILLSDAEASINEKLAKGYGINKKGSDLSVQLKRTPPISDAETDFEFLIKENNRKIGAVGLNKRLGTESNFKKGTYYEKDFDFPYMWVDKKEYLGSGISGEVNKAITDYLQENNLGYLYSSLNHTPEGLKRWEKLVKEGKAERVDKNRYKLKQSGGKIKTDPKGYWNKDNHGKPVRIPSNNISMQDIDFPILGISNTGDMKMMYPNGEYQFQGNSVTEFPIMQQGGQVRQPIKGIKKTGKLLGTYKNGEKVSDWEIID